MLHLLRRVLLIMRRRRVLLYERDKLVLARPLYLNSLVCGTRGRRWRQRRMLVSRLEGRPALRRLRRLPRLCRPLRRYSGRLALRWQISGTGCAVSRSCIIGLRIPPGPGLMGWVMRIPSWQYAECGGSALWWWWIRWRCQCRGWVEPLPRNGCVLTSLSAAHALLALVHTMHSLRMRAFLLLSLLFSRY
jgi:hypothetical protein